MGLEVVNYCVNDKCSRCGRCCTDFAFISDAEISVIKAYLKKHPEIQEQYRYFDERGILHFMCPFYDEKQKKCLIYEVRPRICKRFKCNKSSVVLDRQKKEFPKEVYYNTTLANTKSWHLIFFNNHLHQSAHNMNMERAGIFGDFTE